MLLLALLTFAACAFLTGSLPTIEFLGAAFTREEFAEVKEIVKCFGRKGQWMRNEKRIDIRFDETPIENRLRITPCTANYSPHSQILSSESATSCHHILSVPGVLYEWVVPVGRCGSFNFSQFSTAGLCSVMQITSGLNIAFAGDSQSEHFSLALRNRMVAEAGKESSLTSCGISREEGARMTPVTFQCNATAAASAAASTEGTPTAATRNSTFDLKHYSFRNDFLLPPKFSIPKHMAGAQVRPWLPIEPADANIGVMVLNRGAHYRNNSETLHELNLTFAYLQEHYPEMSLIWRNTPHGHLNVMETFNALPLAAPPLNVEHQYNYDNFQDQNVAVEEFLEKNYPQVLYLDVATSSNMRVDSHSDPLHWCHPGPYDNWVAMFYNALRVVRAYSSARKQ